LGKYCLHKYVTPKACSTEENNKNNGEKTADYISEKKIMKSKSNRTHTKGLMKVDKYGMEKCQTKLISTGDG